MTTRNHSPARRPFVRQAMVDALRELDPRLAVRRPLLLGVALAAALATVLAILRPDGFSVATAVSIWLMVLVLALAGVLVRMGANTLTIRLQHEGDLMARRLRELRRDAQAEVIPASRLRRGDLVLVPAGDNIPADGVVVAGSAVIRSTLSGRSVPLVRESGADRRALVAGSAVLTGWLIVDVWSNPGEDFRQRLLALAERARLVARQEPHGLGVLLLALTAVGLAAGAALQPWAALAMSGDPAPLVDLLALLACAVPASFAGLQAALDVASFRRLLKHNVVTGAAAVVRALGQVDVLLLERASVANRGNCEADELIPMPGVAVEELAGAAFLASLADETPEGRSIVALTERRYGLVPAGLQHARFLPGSGPGRLTGVDLPGRHLRKGDADAIRQFVREHSSVEPPDEFRAAVQAVAGEGGVAIGVADGPRILGVVQLRCRVREALARLRRCGVFTVVSTADTPAAAAALAAEAGVDDFLAEATPEGKLALIRRHQAAGKRVAMVGDGNHDGPAMAQADVAVAINAGPLAAREAGGLVDLDGDPTKLVEAVELGRQQRAVGRMLAAWCLASDLALALVLVPLVISEALVRGADRMSFATCSEGLSLLDPLALHSPRSAVLAGLVVHTLTLACVAPLALRWRGPARSRLGAAVVGVVVTLAAVKLLDLLLFAAFAPDL
ncbi:K+-transporting ATPase ATPase B chain [Nannocystis exedens]|uniref:K+-transporting ATPase ATPase B chain n=1 Tax=Nannocystis exedens TaxID=54 RepID=A0A1I1YAE4_9BACT|nr:HAD-IC family P-type ATPase [Nannocystis exedens]PCC71929.1 potassium-transporting ATPase subunit B [Nannocystis exedens]SFE16595.1 K+-transporting ATPase ATPase B chain [Nannocystis exedens]